MRRIHFGKQSQKGYGAPSNSAKGIILRGVNSVFNGLTKGYGKYPPHPSPSSPKKNTLESGGSKINTKHATPTAIKDSSTGKQIASTLKKQIIQVKNDIVKDLRTTNPINLPTKRKPTQNKQQQGKRTVIIGGASRGGGKKTKQDIFSK